MLSQVAKLGREERRRDSGNDSSDGTGPVTSISDSFSREGLGSIEFNDDARDRKDHLKQTLGQFSLNG